MLETKEQKVFELEKNYDQLKEESKTEKEKLYEELDLEKEKVLSLKKSDLLLNAYKKKLDTTEQ